MTASAAQHADRQLEELEARMRTAWEDYRSSITELAGSDYEEAELVSWERLQRALDELAGERERLAAAAPAPAAADDAS